MWQPALKHKSQSGCHCIALYRSHLNFSSSLAVNRLGITVPGEHRAVVWGAHVYTHIVYCIPMYVYTHIVYCIPMYVYTHIVYCIPMYVYTHIVYCIPMYVYTHIVYCIPTYLCTYLG